MTAEVVIMNCNGVALAADSAVTIGSHKIYNSAVKVFALSKSAPVAAMVYGGALLLNVPWETVIKGFRTSLGKKRFDTVGEYSDHLLKHLSAVTYFSADAQKKWLVERTASYLELIKQRWLEAAERVVEETGKGIPPGEVLKILTEVLRSHVDEIQKRPSLGIPKAKVRTLRTKVHAAAEDAGRLVFQGAYEEISEGCREIGWALFEKEIFPNNHSGVVIAGFGDEEIFPGLVAIEIDGMLSGVPRYRIDKRRSACVGDESSASIVPFAQEDMVRTFMEGVNPGFRRFVDAYLGELFRDLPSALVAAMAPPDKSKAAVRKRLKAACDSLLSDFHSKSEEHRQRHHVDPVLQMVAVLPKDELAAMAEALVNLTAFKRRVTGSLETVGGPVDVCVITKGDGLVWVKRKHYFPAELNHHFFANYSS